MLIIVKLSDLITQLQCQKDKEGCTEPLMPVDFIYYYFMNYWGWAGLGVEIRKQ